MSLSSQKFIEYGMFNGHPTGCSALSSELSLAHPPYRLLLSILGIVVSIDPMANPSLLEEGFNTQLGG
jgi:hypothetical protein